MFNIWQVTLAQNCNLRCTYCSTGYGTYGMPPGGMDERVLKRLTSCMLEMAEHSRPLQVEYGGGETTLYFNRWIASMDAIAEAAAQRNMPIELHCTTNGTLLEKGQLDLLADRGVGLVFSIDGPKENHDRYRRDAQKGGSFDRAIASWQYYRELSHSHPKRPSCDIQSVITDHTRLGDLARFWHERGEPVFGAVIQLDSRFLGKQDGGGCRARQRNYLDDMRQWALAQAQASNIPHFLSEFQGPADLLERWTDLFTGKKRTACGAGWNTLGVDAKGGLYPCEGYIGVAQWRMGDVFTGLDMEKLDRFRRLRSTAENQCSDCTFNQTCPKPCFAADPWGDIGKNVASECWFFKSLVTIAQESYGLLAD